MISTRGGWLRVDRHGERLQFVAETKLSSCWGLVQCRHDVPVVPAQVLILMIFIFTGGNDHVSENNFEALLVDVDVELLQSSKVVKFSRMSRAGKITFRLFSPQIRLQMMQIEM